MKTFCVADLTPAGDLQLQEWYAYAQLEQIPYALDLITEFSTSLWRSPDEFQLQLPLAPLASSRASLSLRWRSTSDTTGIATLRLTEPVDDPLLAGPSSLCTISLLVAGVKPEADALTLSALQSRLLEEFHDTGTEPAFSLMHLKERPLVASIHLRAPTHPDEQNRFAIADRCFAASFFRKLGLA